MIVFAHRGILNQFPENSMRGLMAAVDHGFGIETDLRQTADGDFILIHDDTFEKLAGRKTSVRSVTRNQATHYTYTDSADTFISLRMFLEKLREQEKKPALALHLKADSQNEIGYHAIAAYWKEFDLYSHAFVFDLTINAAQKLKALDTGIKIACITSETKFEPTVYLWDEIKDIDCFNYIWAAEYKTFYTKDRIYQMKQKKEKVYAMSPDVHRALGHPRAYAGYEETWKDLIQWGIDGICTDEPIKLNILLRNNTV